MKKCKKQKLKAIDKRTGKTNTPNGFRKGLFLLSVMLFICHVASAQIKVGVLACPQFNESSGIRIGTDLDIPLNARWSFVPGVYWSLRNRNSYTHQESDYGDNVIRSQSNHFRDKAHFLTVPLRASVHLAGRPNGNFTMKLLFGPYIAYGITGTSKCTSTEEDMEKHTNTGAFSADGRYRHRWDYGINGGLNMLLKRHFVLGLFMEAGCREIYNTNSRMEDVLGDIFFVNKINIAGGVSFGYQF